MYVAYLDNEVVGSGAISSFWGSQDESILLTIFVLPELQGKGIGRLLVDTLEKDEYFLRAKRIEIPASITACEFYRKMGYDYKDGINKLDDEGNYRLEKFR
jgi:GNAT superfamily N-acetyltransferase